MTPCCVSSTLTALLSKKITVESAKSSVADFTVFLMCVLNTCELRRSQRHVIKPHFIFCHAAFAILEVFLVSLVASGVNGGSVARAPRAEIGAHAGLNPSAAVWLCDRYSRRFHDASHRKRL